MPTEQNPNFIERLLQLISEMNFSVGLSNGLQASGLAVLLLALVAVVFIRSKPFKQSKLVDLIRAWRIDRSNPKTVGAVCPHTPEDISGTMKGVRED